MLNEWNGFNDGVWTKEINVRKFLYRKTTLSMKEMTLS